MNELIDILNNEEKQSSSYKKTIVTTIAYLIGVDKRFLDDDKKFEREKVTELTGNETANIIRSLCTLRTQFFKYYTKIYDARRNYRTIESLSEYLDIDCLKFLHAKGMEIANVTTEVTPAVYVSYINQYIQNNVDNIRDLFPEWVNFNYIRSLFLMPKGYSGKYGGFIKDKRAKVLDTIIKASISFFDNREVFPYQMFLTWNKDLSALSLGNILLNDLKFLTSLYKAFDDDFKNKKYVTNAAEEEKENIYEFLSNSAGTIVYVDCENADPYALAATLDNLGKGNLAKIKEIKLFDDENASTAWDCLCSIINIPVDHIEVERLLENKSRVDMKMMLSISNEFHENDIASAIIVSSDSDFWTAIEDLKRVKFYVFNERKKTSPKFTEALDMQGIPHCYMDDIAPSKKVQQFKAKVLSMGLESKIAEFNETGNFWPININSLLDELFFDAKISAQSEQELEKEKQAFFDKHLKNGLKIKPVTECGEWKLEMQLQISK